LRGARASEPAADEAPAHATTRTGNEGTGDQPATTNESEHSLIVVDGCEGSVSVA
jgi:hypothetical protein